MKPPKRITVRFHGDEESWLDAVVLAFDGDEGWTGGHVYQLVPKRKRKAAK